MDKVTTNVGVEYATILLHNTVAFPVLDRPLKRLCAIWISVQVTYSVHHVLVSHRFNTYIYHSMLLIVHGGWSGWTDFSDCPKPCNGSQYFRTRLCNDPPPNHGGLPCDGGYLEYQPCNTHRCPGDCTAMSISHISLNSGNILL